MDTVIHNKTTHSSLEIRTNYIPPSVWQLALCIYLEKIQDFSQTEFTSTLLPTGALGGC